ncbi:phage terminase large subunit family protein [Comamonas terrigena]|uniref:phage terminase large subunit family protein n=1 Tax=Comamonas terrigena TaxID=32013 RepID=UPI00289DBB60|nr:phage terminase large subunit family protein [Comamonas terrigena]
MNAPLTKEAMAAIKAAVSLGLSSLRAEVPQTLSEWAAEHFILAGESSHQKGGWVGWPFQQGILDFMSDDRIEELAVKKSKRVGYTKMITAFVAYNIAHRRRKQALWQPTDDDRDSYVKSEIEPVLDGVAAVRSARRQGRGVEDTIKYKPFRDSVLHLLGGKAARAYRRITVAVAILDEWSAFDQSIEKSGDPGSLAKGRLEGAPYPKFVGGSTPRVKGLCPVDRACEESGAYVQYHIECPRCGLEHPLSWGGKDVPWGFKWSKGQPDTVRHVCPHCRESITQADYLPGGWPLTGAWVCRKTGTRYGADRIWRNALGQPCRAPRTLGVQVWAAYSPQRTWVSIVDEFEKAHRAMQVGDVGPMTSFTNETLGEVWELKGDSGDEHALQARADEYPLGIVPAGALVLTAGVDVQRDRWEISIWGWARGLESWLVAHHVIHGNPANEGDWEPVGQYLQQRFPQAWHGGSMGLSAVSIDSSDQTQAVYNWVRNMQAQITGLRAIKGDNNDSRPIVGPSSLQEVNHRGRKIARGIKLWLVGVDNAKDLLLGQLAIAEPGPGYVHTSKALPREWYEQLTAEQRILTKVNGKDTYRWVKRRPRNEVLDCRNYSLHAAMCLGLHKWADTRWQQQEQAVQPPQDLFSPASTAPSVPVPAAQAMPVADSTTTPEASALPGAPKPTRKPVDDALFAPISLQ